MPVSNRMVLTWGCTLQWKQTLTLVQTPALLEASPASWLGHHHSFPSATASKDETWIPYHKGTRLHAAWSAHNSHGSVHVPQTDIQLFMQTTGLNSRTLLCTCFPMFSSVACISTWSMNLVWTNCTNYPIHSITIHIYSTFQLWLIYGNNIPALIVCYVK